MQKVTTMPNDTLTQNPPPPQLTLRIGDAQSIAGEIEIEVAPGQGAVEIVAHVYEMLRNAAAQRDMRLLESVTPFSAEPMAKAIAIAAAAHIARLEARIAVLEAKAAPSLGSGEFVP